MFRNVKLTCSIKSSFFNLISSVSHKCCSEQKKWTKWTKQLYATIIIWRMSFFAITFEHNQFQLVQYDIFKYYTIFYMKLSTNSRQIWGNLDGKILMENFQVRYLMAIFKYIYMKIYTNSRPLSNKFIWKYLGPLFVVEKCG